MARSLNGWFAGVLITLVAAAPAAAALKVGDKAPDFTATATQGGAESTFSLAASLNKGPVVLYFYPAAFTPGCTREAHAFADAIDQFKGLGAVVLGVSHDPLDKLKEFSISECRGKFAVAADPDQKIMKAYDSILPANPERANRTSYVIVPDGTIIHTFTDLKPDEHVGKALAALSEWRQQHP
jgi:peroxiredoxin